MRARLIYINPLHTSFLCPSHLLTDATHQYSSLQQQQHVATYSGRPNTRLGPIAIAKDGEGDSPESRVVSRQHTDGETSRLAVAKADKLR